MPAKKPYSEQVIASRRAARARYRATHPHAANQPSRHNPCACGRPKRPESKSCKACYNANRPKGKDLVKRVERQRRWRAAHPDYYRDLARVRRANRPNAKYNQCPGCDGRKERVRTICHKCEIKARNHGPQPFSKPLPCWVCDVPLREAFWHDAKFLRCPSCGLEIAAPPAYAGPEFYVEAA